jgi:hypothetical protein
MLLGVIIASALNGLLVTVDVNSAGQLVFRAGGTRKCTA